MTLSVYSDLAVVGVGFAKDAALVVLGAMVVFAAAVFGYLHVLKLISFPPESVSRASLDSLEKERNSHAHWERDWHNSTDSGPVQDIRKW